MVPTAFNRGEENRHRDRAGSVYLAEMRPKTVAAGSNSYRVLPAPRRKQLLRDSDGSIQREAALNRQFGHSSVSRSFWRF